MKNKLFILLILLCICLVSCVNSYSESNSSDAASQESDESSDAYDENSISNESSDVNNENSIPNENSETEVTHDKIIVNENVTPVEFEKANDEFSVLVYDDGGLFTSEFTYYAKYGNSVYTCVDYKQNNGEIICGTAEFVDGKMTNFFPNIFEVVRYEDSLYGVLCPPVENFIDSQGIYCKLNTDGSYVELFECGNPTFADNRIYYPYYDKAKSVNQIVSADLDGNNKTVMSENAFPIGVYAFSINESILFSPAYNEYVLISDSKESVFLESDDSYIQYVDFINNGYAYYSKVEFTSRGYSDTVEIWRKKADDGFCEKILSVEEDHSVVTYVIFANKFLMFLPDGIYAFESDFSSMTMYDYGKHEYEEIVQICVTSDELAIITLDEESFMHKTTVYDTSGEIVFEYAGQT